MPFAIVAALMAGPLVAGGTGNYGARRRLGIAPCGSPPRRPAL